MKLNFLSARNGRRATEAGVAVLILGLIAGVLLGTGLAPTIVSTSDGLTWLGDGERGEAVQINPATGKQQSRLRVAEPGHELQLAQQNGLLVVTDTTTGAVTVIDVATLVSGGRWSGTGAGAIEVLLHGNELYAVDRTLGTVHRLDPVTATGIGAMWSAGGLIADAAIDGDGVLWVLRGDGRLSSLRWSVPHTRLVESSPAQSVLGAGMRSMLVGHGRGITILVPESGRVVRIGTGSDSELEMNSQTGILQPATEAPADLVPVTVRDAATVLVVHHDRVITVNVGELGCHKPGEPIVYRGNVYVACHGAGKVIVLSRDGRHLGRDIIVPQGEPRLVLDDGHLFIHIAGAPSGVVIGPDGNVRSTVTHDDSVPVRDPAETTPRTAPTSSRPRTGNSAGGLTVGSPTGGSVAPSATPGPDTTPATPTPSAPGGVSISALFEYSSILQVEAQWSAPVSTGSPVTGYSITLTTDRGAPQNLQVTALRSGPVELSCGTRCHGMRVTAEVRAINEFGPGATGTGGYAHHAPAVSPGAGDVVITGLSANDYAPIAFYVTMNPGFAWRTYEGTCTLAWSGPRSGSMTIPCWAKSQRVSWTGYTNGTYQFWVQAGATQSAYSGVDAWREPPEPPGCRLCDIP